MKKLVTLILVLAGIVGTASARSLYLKISEDGWWSDAGIVTYITFDNGSSWSEMTETYMYGHKWNICEIPASYSSVKVARGTSHWNETPVDASLLSGDADKYISITTPSNVVTLTEISAPRWNYMTFRQNIISSTGEDGTTWDLVDDNSTSHPDGNTFTFELTKAQVDASSHKGEGIYLRLRNGDYLKYNDAGTWVGGYPQIYPNESPATIAFSESTSSYYQNTDDTGWSWNIAIPSYDYEKIVLTAKYINDGGYKWKISADAYITKTVNKAQKWATLGCDGAALDLSGLAEKSITAYPLTVSSKGVITKGTPITGVLAANKGVLLETAADENVTLSIPVSAEAGTDGSTQLIATTGTRVDKVTESGYTNYILTEQDSHVGFYMVNNSGNGMLANTAYLHVADTYVPTEARAFFWFEDETTGIEAAKASQKMNGEFFNLAGQRVAQPAKGLYIVNGKKVIMK